MALMTKNVVMSASYGEKETECRVEREKRNGVKSGGGCVDKSWEVWNDGWSVSARLNRIGVTILPCFSLL